MAFAMKLAAKNADLAACPVCLRKRPRRPSGPPARPPIRLVKIGPPGHEVLIGNETVMFRHREDFRASNGAGHRLRGQPAHRGTLSHHRPRSAGTAWSGSASKLRLDLVLVDNFKRRSQALRSAGEIGGRRHRAWASSCASTNAAALEAGLQLLEGQRPLIHAATPANAEEIAALALKYDAPLVARAATLDELAALTTRLAALG